jgi:hypothetical protein
MATMSSQTNRAHEIKRAKTATNKLGFSVLSCPSGKYKRGALLFVPQRHYGTDLGRSARWNVTGRLDVGSVKLGGSGRSVDPCGRFWIVSTRQGPHVN